jgi:hypothetical protein
LYTSTLIAIWQRLISLNISWDFDIPGKVIRKRGMFTVVVPFGINRQVVDICLMLLISKPRFTNTSEMSSAGVMNGRCHIRAFVGCWDLG